MQAPVITPEIPLRDHDAALEFPSDEARWASFGAALDEIQKRAKAKVGEEDLQYIRRVDRVSRTCEVVGRGLLYLGPGPVSFAAGCTFLWLYKQLHATEIGHPVLHGAYNKIPGDHGYHSHDYEWRAPIDEQSWIVGHNGKHHGLTNVNEADPDIDFGHARLTEHTPHRFSHYFQVPITLLTMPVFSVAMNAHFTGLVDLYVRPEDEKLHFAGDRSDESKKKAWARFNRKAKHYYAWEFGVLPLVGGPRFFRVLAGNVLTEMMRDVYTAATIYCGHVGDETASFPAGTRPRSKGERYAMQVSSANNFRVPWAVSVLCGALDLQIEHHLFPQLPANRLREIAPEVCRVCEAHGVEYRMESWPRTLGRVVKHLWRLSFPTAHDRAGAAEPTMAPPVDDAVLAAE